MDEKDKSFNDLVAEKIKKKNNRIKRRMIAIGILSAFLFISVVILFMKTSGKTFEFEGISTDCHGYKVTGNLEYNNDTKTLYIDSISYCGGTDDNQYDKIEAVLFENADTPIVVSSFASQTDITLEEYLKQLSLEEEDYLEKCNTFNDESLYLEITTTKKESQKIFKASLSIGKSCIK